jgi:hypothetical protein
MLLLCQGVQKERAHQPSLYKGCLRGSEKVFTGEKCVTGSSGFLPGLAGSFFKFGLPS